jgi:hypothetical protein
MRLRLIGCLAASLLLAGSAQGLTLNSVTMNNLTAGVWGDGIAPEPDCPSVAPFCPGQLFTDSSTGIAPNGVNYWRSSTTPSVSSNSFVTRFFNALGSQSQTVINTALHYDADHEVILDISSATPWTLTLDLSRVAQIDVVDGSGIGTDTGEIIVSVLSTTISGATLDSGSLALAGHSRTSDGGDNLNQLTSAILSGTGNAIVTLTMRFDIDTYTEGQVFGSGDSVCYAGGALPFVGTDCPNVALPAQGVFLSGELTAVPEPTTALLLAAGLAGLAAAGRKPTGRSSA